MKGRAGIVVLVVILMPWLAGAQVSMQPTPRPIVTAENEGWYLAGDPITYAGNFYYPAGADVYFDPNEMVRTGSYLGIPLYARTTEEPYSKVYVPLAGGLMQPYERRRAGELAGTVGSSAPGYPVVNPAEQRREPAWGAAGIAQAPAPPTFAPYANEPSTAPRANVTVPLLSALPAPPSAPTTGTGRTRSNRAPKVLLKPNALNAVFIDYAHHRWFSSGPAVLLDASRFTRIGDYHGFSVYRERRGSESTIYVQLAENVTSYVTPYSLRS
jgi:hypothetical protein